MVNRLTEKAYALRQEVVKLIYKNKCGHMGGDLSVMDILVTLYYHETNTAVCRKGDRNRDRFILSKGHTVEALYVVLADCGFFPGEDLDTYSQFGSTYIGHPNNKINGIEINSGSLGHGLSVACGMALAGKKDNLDYRVYTVMGDGELSEGSVWEGAMFAGHYRLDNLCAVVDCNGLQISGTTEEVMNHTRLKEQFESFGWKVLGAGGNDIGELIRGFEQARKEKGRPTLIIAGTTKGCGVSFMENQVSWHHRVPNEEEYLRALKELEEKRMSCHA